MRYIITLTNVSRNDSETLGFRAADLSVLKEKGFNIPLSFIVNSEAFEDFMAENGLKAKIERVFQEKQNPGEAYQEIMSLFVKSKFPRELQAELQEAYDSLAIEPGAPASSIISGVDYPFVNLIRSPGYILPAEDEEGIIQNVRGHEELSVAVKLVWSTAFSPESQEYRQKAGISERFSMGLLVQKMKKTKFSAIAYSRTDFNEYMIRVKSFRGYQDYAEPITGKDVHEVDVNSLLIRQAQVNNQEYEITRAIEKDELVHTPLLDDGSRQKLNDKLISECARLTKRAKSSIGKDIKIYFGIYDEVINVLQVNRLSLQAPKEIVEAESITVKQDESGTTITETQEVAVAAKESFQLPPLLSSDEAKESAMKDLGHKLFSLSGFIEESPQAPEPAPPVEVIPEASSQAAIEREIEKEETILEHVLKIKEVIERMEEHALNNNKESYEQEARRVKQLLKKIREE